MEIKDIDNYIKSFVQKIFRYNNEIYKLTDYKYGELTFTEMSTHTDSPKEIKLKIEDPLIQDFKLLVPYEHNEEKK